MPKTTRRGRKPRRRAARAYWRMWLPTCFPFFLAGGLSLVGWTLRATARRCGDAAAWRRLLRERDDAGRHTTVARVMVSLPGGGVVADAPGLRSLPLVGHERGLARVFPEVVEAAHGCRFNDCTHTHEPGCAVREAEAAGELDSVRLEACLTLARAMRVSAQSLDPDVKL